MSSLTNIQAGAVIYVRYPYNNETTVGKIRPCIVVETDGNTALLVPIISIRDDQELSMLTALPEVEAEKAGIKPTEKYKGCRWCSCEVCVFHFRRNSPVRSGQISSDLLSKIRAHIEKRRNSLRILYS